MKGNQWQVRAASVGNMAGRRGGTRRGREIVTSVALNSILFETEEVSIRVRRGKNVFLRCRCRLAVMSSRALRRLRQEKEVSLVSHVDPNDNDEESDQDNDEMGGHVTSNAAFLHLLEHDSESEEESDSDTRTIDTDNSRNHEKSKWISTSNRKKDKPSEVEQDLDAILSESSPSFPPAVPVDALPITLRSLLLSPKNGFHVQHLDLDQAMKSLLGLTAGNPVGPATLLDFNNEALPEGGRPQARHAAKRASRNRRTFMKRYLFGKPQLEWGVPPSYIGGGLGMKELTAQSREEERHCWTVPWPYNLEENQHPIPLIPQSQQKWFTFQMSDTYQDQQFSYEEIVRSSSPNSNLQPRTLDDPNALAMFVADNPFFAQTILQLAMVLYHINERRRGNDLLRRCMFLYETAILPSVMPGKGSSNSHEDGDLSHVGFEVLIDVDREPNSAFFRTLFRIMQTSGMVGYYANALAVGRLLLSFDPLRDPMGVLLILDYYALAGRQTVTAAMASGGLEDAGGDVMELGASFVVHLVDSDLVHIHYKDPLTSRHHWCPLIFMPSWAYSYALALYRLAKNESPINVNMEKRATDALTQALTQFPMVLSKLATMNIFNSKDRSFRMDWPKVLPFFNGDVKENNVKDSATKVAGEHLVRIYVQRCHKLWGEAGVLQWLYHCCEMIVESHTKSPLTSESVAQTPLTSNFSPALERYSQCDPSEYQDAFRTFPPEAIALNPNIVAEAMVYNPNRQGRFLQRDWMREGRQIPVDGNFIDRVRRMLGLELEEAALLDPDMPLLQLYLQSLLPWVEVDGVRGTRR